MGRASKWRWKLLPFHAKPVRTLLTSPLPLVLSRGLIFLCYEFILYACSPACQRHVNARHGHSVKRFLQSSRWPVTFECVSVSFQAIYSTRSLTPLRANEHVLRNVDTQVHQAHAEHHWAHHWTAVHVQLHCSRAPWLRQLREHLCGHRQRTECPPPPLDRRACQDTDAAVSSHSF